MYFIYRKLSYLCLALMLVPFFAAQEARAESAEADLTVPNRCPGNGISVERNMCLSDVLRRVEERRSLYLATALKRYQFKRGLADLIVASDATFIAYRGAECAAASEWWDQDEDKTIGVFAQLNCEIELTDQRTHQIWQNFLIYVDDIPPILPVPEPYPVERIHSALW